MNAIHTLIEKIYPLITTEKKDSMENNIAVVKDFIKNHMSSVVINTEEMPVSSTSMNTVDTTNTHQSEVDCVHVTLKISTMQSISDIEHLPPPAFFKVAQQKITCTLCKNNGWKICEPRSLDGKITGAFSKLKFNLKEHLQSPKHKNLSSRLENCVHMAESHHNTQFKAAYKCVSCVYEHILLNVSFNSYERSIAINSNRLCHISNIKF